MDLVRNAAMNIVLEDVLVKDPKSATLVIMCSLW